MTNELTIITGARKAVVRIVATEGRIITILRLRDAGAATTSAYTPTLPELRWTAGRKGDTARILRSVLENRTVAKENA